MKLIRGRAVDCALSKSRSHSRCLEDMPMAQVGSELGQLVASVAVRVLVHAPVKSQQSAQK